MSITGAARVFRYRKEHVVCYPLLATRRQVRIYKDGTLQEPYDTLFDYGKYVAGRRRRLAFAGGRQGSKRSMRSRSPQRAATFLFRGGSRSQSLSGSSRPIRKPQRRFPKGRRKVRMPPCSPRRCSASIRRIPVRLYAYLNGRTAACDVDNVALVYPFGCNASQKLAVPGGPSTTLTRLPSARCTASFWLALQPKG